MKILITGADGQVGKEISLTAKGHELLALPHSELDITLFDEVLKVVKNFTPTHIINCAAYNDVDGAEDAPESAFMANAIGPANLALASVKQKIILVHYSTDYVFDGKKSSPYTETDTPNPLSTYARSKLLGEQAVLSISPNSYIMRVAWVYSRDGNNFVTRLLKFADSGKDLKFVDDYFCTPTYAPDIACATMKLIGANSPFGIYHAVGCKMTTPYEWAKDVLKRERPQTQITSVSGDSFKTKAIRPRRSILANTKLDAMNIALRGFDETLVEKK